MDIKNINNNPLSSRWKKRYAEQSEEVKLKLDELSTMKPKEYQLKVIKKSKEAPKEGDVFVLNPEKNVYFYGKVLEADIQNKNNDVFIQGKNVVFIFAKSSSNIDFASFEEDYNNLLISPEIVDESYWKKGYFYTVGNMDVTDNEKRLDYGFYKVSSKKFYSVEGDILDKQPKIFGSYGIATITGIASKVMKELIINPSLKG